MSDTNQEPVVTTPDLIARILCRAMSAIGWITADDFRQREYIHEEFKTYTEYAKANNLRLPTGDEFTKMAMEDINFVRDTISAILTTGTAAPNAPQIGQYL